MKDEGIKKVEEAAPLWDSVREELYFEYIKANVLQARLRAVYNPRFPREMKEEQLLRESIYRLWGGIQNKALLQKHAKRYSKLFELRNYKRKPNVYDLLEYFELIGAFLEEYGITKVGNTELKYEPTHKILQGFVSAK